MRVQLAGVGKHHGAQVVLEQVTLTIGERARIGLVGPNGVGKTTLLRLLAGLEQPDTGSVSRAPERLTVGYLAQERSQEGRVSVLESLARQAGIEDAERELEAAAHALAAGLPADDRYAAALERLVSLGAESFDARARATCAELGLGIDLDRELVGLSGGEASRVALAAILLSRFDALLLDEPTNDLDFDGLDRLEQFLDSYRGALVVVSHDREFLDRTVDRIAAIGPDTHRVREWAGGWSDYEAARDTERAAAVAEYEQAQARRRQLTQLLSTRRTEARSKGAALGDKTGGQDRRATHALQTKVR
jgi:ATPase subunit of ABC transporter with duplicated ATPase domains